MAINFIHSIIDPLRDRYAPVSYNSTFRQTGQITPEEFILAGDFLVYKFPSWSWVEASSPSKRVSYLPETKQFLVTKGVPCHRRLEDIAENASAGETIVHEEGGDPDADGWLRTGGGAERETTARVRDVRTLDGSGEVAEKDENLEESIPDMEDEEDDDAIIREPPQANKKDTLRTYDLYITYTPYYRTPRLYLSGYLSPSEPLPPTAMMDDIMGDYKDKTVTLEDFPFLENTLKMASVHPCRHASVMKTLLDRADAALRLRRDRVSDGKGNLGMGGLVDETKGMAISEVPGYKDGVKAAGGGNGDEWEVLQGEDVKDEMAIRVDQYLIVFLKVSPKISSFHAHT